MAVRDVVVVGASAGGVAALQTLLGSWTPDLPAAVLVVLHLPEHATGVLPDILGRRCALPVASARDGAPVRAGTVCVAPADRHLEVVRHGDALEVRLTDGPEESGHRPGVDALFRSAAAAAGPRVVAVVLTGAQDDGAEGLRQVRVAGGVAVVQDPADAEHTGMPASALSVAGADHCGPLRRLGPLVADLCGLPVADVAGPAAAGDRVVQDALRTAVRCLEDKASLTRRMSDRAQELGHRRTADRYARQSAEAVDAAAVLREGPGTGPAAR